MINSENLTVTPGFINPHGHMDWFLHEDNIVLHSVAQGVTTECTGNCGVAIHTMSEDFAKLLKKYGL